MLKWVSNKKSMQIEVFISSICILFLFKKEILPFPTPMPIGELRQKFCFFFEGLNWEKMYI